MQNFKNVNLDAGLYFVATPIGNARDVSLRALDILASADVLVAEDTRSLRKLLDIHGVPVKGRFVMSYHDHSAQRDRERVFDAISKGQSVAYASEAGTPLIADPGYQLSRYAAEHNVPLTSAPGMVNWKPAPFTVSQVQRMGRVAVDSLSQGAVVARSNCRSPSPSPSS